ncbi:Chitinase 1 [Phytophthora boehmeriae]|uniref:Chitinase 1 n=1 Tax=Phytophthora boehmeriae TaxID=109152 RepID=A0A8T1WWX5_9STRA|nr:Chitinase 1 [Phytophthora boehmeriae]
MKFAGAFISMCCLLGVSSAGHITQSTQAKTPCPKSTPEHKSGFARFFNQDQFHAMFPDAVPLYNFDGLVNAANKYTKFANTGNETNDRRELAAFLAQTAHQCDNFKAAEEYARNTYTVWQYCDNSTYPCAPGRRYHGRGPIQLSWNYNYFNAGKALGIDLLNNPDIVANDTAVTWMTALWYWMTPQDGRVIHDVVAGVDGFAESTSIVMGRHCSSNASTTKDEQLRAGDFQRMCDALEVQPLGSVMCNAQTN